jgi:hypothetical protein
VQRLVGQPAIWANIQGGVNAAFVNDFVCLQGT